MLKALIVSGEIRCGKDERLPALEVWEKFCKPRHEFAGFLFSKFRPRLRAMQERHIKESGPKEPHPWKNSKAQGVLKALILSGDIRCDEGERIPALEVWTMFCEPRQEFAGFLFSNFPSRLKAMQDLHIQKRGRAATEAALLVHHKEHFPAPSHNHRGVPRWNGSEAERLLKLDVLERKNEVMEPKDLRATRIKYQVYQPDVFRKHIHQEVRAQKLRKQYSNKNTF